MHHTDYLPSPENVKEFQVIWFDLIYANFPLGVPFPPLSTFQILYILKIQLIISFNKYLNSYPLLDAVLGNTQWRKRDFSFSCDGIANVGLTLLS